jgi:sarcosine oxidase subunit beta
VSETADAVIIGGGVTGTSIAYHLAKRGHGKGTLLLERNGLASGSTAAAGGGIRSQFSTDINVRMSIESVRFWRSFEEEMGMSADYREIGYLFLLSTEREVEQFQGYVALQNSMGVPSRFIEDDEARRLVPGLTTDDLTGIVWNAEDARAGPNEATQAYAKRAKAGGVDIRTGVEVTGIDVSGGRVRAVETSQGRIETTLVVDAAGPWAADVGRLAGVEVPVQPYRRTVFISEPFDGLPPRMPILIDMHRGWAVVQEGARFYMLGSVDRASSYDLTIDWDSLEWSIGIALHRLPQLARAQFGNKAFAGLYDVSPDNHAILGRVPDVDGFLLACGFSGHGFQHSPATGRIIADLIVDGRVEWIDVGALSVTRFRDGKLIREGMTAYAEVLEG